MQKLMPIEVIRGGGGGGGVGPFVGTAGRQPVQSGLVKIGQDQDLLTRPIACSLRMKSRLESPGDQQHPWVCNTAHQSASEGWTVLRTKLQSAGLLPSCNSPSATKSKLKKLPRSAPMSRKKANVSITCKCTKHEAVWPAAAIDNLQHSVWLFAAVASCSKRGDAPHNT